MEVIQEGFKLTDTPTGKDDSDSISPLIWSYRQYSSSFEADRQLIRRILIGLRPEEAERAVSLLKNHYYMQFIESALPGTADGQRRRIRAFVKDGLVANVYVG